MSELDYKTIPPESEERPVRIFNSIVLANDAYHCRPIHLWPKELSEAKAEWLPPMEQYLAAFCKPIRTIANEINCIACDEQVTGHQMGLADYRFKAKLNFEKEGTWEGRCASCGYPCRLKHDIFVPGTSFRIVGLTEFPLFYHPHATQKSS